jgi:HNH endonuclease
VTCFQDWEFPKNLPPAWRRVPQANLTPGSEYASQSQLGQAVRSRDISCRVTKHHTGVEVAHLCPKHEMDWFRLNTMSIYNTNRSLDLANLTNDPANAFLLRSDLHLAFDNRQFAFFPKNSQGYAVHMLESSSDIRPIYHNTLVHPILDCAIQFVYARFAWAIFPSLSTFLSRPGVKRTVVRLRSDENKVTREVIEIRDMSDLKLAADASRSSNPRKRSRLASNQSGNIQVAHQLEQSGQKGRPPAMNLNERSCHTAPATASFSTTSSGLPVTMSPPSTGDSQECLQRLKQEALTKQRPPGYNPPKFYNRMPAREALELMGVEIIDDEEDDEVGLMGYQSIPCSQP